ncbi:hypothetical protein AB1L42_16045 [Thalassoglobus sp. JC818]|uniref:hypothetical protein n=1 Tax=Thalassoglobus sp. JC818 TaxID=3232136 RepID=UPI00345A52BD
MSDPLSLTVVFDHMLTQEAAEQIIDTIVKALNRSWGLDEFSEETRRNPPHLLDSEGISHLLQKFNANSNARICFDAGFRVSPSTEINYVFMIGEEYVPGRFYFDISVLTHKATYEDSWPENAAILVEMFEEVCELFPVVDKNMNQYILESAGKV